MHHLYRDGPETRLGCQKQDRNDAETTSSWMGSVKPWICASGVREAVDPNILLRGARGSPINSMLLLRVEVGGA